MSSSRQPAIEYGVFGAFTAASLFTGLYFALRRRSGLKDASSSPGGVSTPKEAGGGGRSQADEEFLGGRRIGAVPLALSVLASMVTATALMGFTAHFYAYGMHMLWASITVFVLLPFITHVVIPLVRRLGVTSVFQYIRFRFGNAVGISACVVYFILNQIQGAVSIFAAAVALSTSFHVPLTYSSLAIGAFGTLYTALGGMRGVVWTDSVQGILILVCPLTILGTIAYDSMHSAASSQLRPFSDIDMRPYLLQARFDLTNDENVWACAVGLLAGHAYRMGMDQMVVQRYASAKTLKDAQRTALMGSVLLVVSTSLLAAVAMALVYWYRDCDPLLSGTIKNIEQVIPHYINERLSAVPGFTGLFLAGVVSATLSTVSSAINSLAASVYVDILSPFLVINDRFSSATIKSLAFLFGAMMTGLAVAVPYIGSAVRLIMVVHSSASGPFIGLFVLALAFPWANGKMNTPQDTYMTTSCKRMKPVIGDAPCAGAAVATALTLAFQAWAVTGRLLYGLKPPRMPVTLDRCQQLGSGVALSPSNLTSTLTNLTKEADIFPVYRLSSYWGGLFSALATVAIGLAISVLTGGGKDVKRHLPFTSDAFIRLWRRFQLLTGPELDHDGQVRSHENAAEVFAMENTHVSTTKL